jgi:hypothetical protein
MRTLIILALCILINVCLPLKLKAQAVEDSTSRLRLRICIFEKKSSPNGTLPEETSPEIQHPQKHVPDLPLPPNPGKIPDLGKPPTLGDWKKHREQTIEVENPLETYCGRKLFYRPSKDMPFASKDDWIIIRFGKNDSLITIGEAKLDFIKVIAKGKEHINRNVLKEDKDKKQYYLELDKLADLGHGAEVQLVLNYEDNKNPTEAYFVFKHKIVPYKLAGTIPPFWIPVGLFSTNFKRTEDGIPFASMPIGLAMGWKWYFSNDSHIGLSVVGNWLIYPKSEVVTTSGEKRKVYNLSAVSLGLLFDLRNYLYVGYAYGWDLKKDGRDPRNMFVIGFAPDLLQLFKSLTP